MLLKRPNCLWAAYQSISRSMWSYGSPKTSSRPCT
jgi:hypothetical protein